MLRDALKVSEMRMARKKVAKEPGVPVHESKNSIIVYIKIITINECSHSSVGRVLDWLASLSVSQV